MRMHCALPLLVLASWCSAGFAKQPDPARETIQLFRRNLVFTLPSGFTRVTDKSNGTNVLIEYVPAGQTTANWTRMVTIQAYRGLWRSTYPTSAIAKQAFYPASCPSGPLYADLGEKLFTKGLMRTIVVNGCGKLSAGAYPQARAGAAEQDFIMVFRDAETIYTLNYAERGPALKMRKPSEAEALLRSIFGNVSL